MSEIPPADEGEPEASRPDPHQRWNRDHGADVPRTSSGALPPRILILVILIFIVGFYLFRRWRQQYVTYGADSSGELSVVLTTLGLG